MILLDKTCPVCGQVAMLVVDADRHAAVVSCSSCTPFRVSARAVGEVLPRWSERSRKALSAYVRGWNREKRGRVTLLLDSDTLAKLAVSLV